MIQFIDPETLSNKENSKGESLSEGEIKLVLWVDVSRLWVGMRTGEIK